MSSNGIVAARIDERLIHGQVSTMWTNQLKATRIMVVDNDVVKSEVDKLGLKTAVPPGIKLSILTIDGAARRINQGKYIGQRVFLIAKNPKVFRELVDRGVQFSEINVGNMSKKENTKQIRKSVNVSPEDLADLTYLTDQGIKVFAQMVPSDEPVDFMKLI